MPSETTLTQGQTLPAIAAICADSTDAVIDFTLATSATYTARLASAPDTIIINAQAAAFGSPRTDGELLYQQTALNVADVSELESKWRVVWADGRISFHPTSKTATENYHLVHIVDDAAAVD